MSSWNTRIASGLFLGLIGSGCGGSNAEPQQPLALAAAPDAEVPYSRACGVERITVKPPEPLGGSDSSITLEGRVDAACAEVWLVAHRVGTIDYTVQAKGTVKSNGDWIARAEFDTTSVGTQKIFEILAIGNPTQALEPGQVIPSWPKAGARSDIVVVNQQPAPACPAASSPSGTDGKE